MCLLLAGLAIFCLGQPISHLNTSILEDLAALLLVYFLKMKRQNSCKINSSQCTNVLQTSSYEIEEEIVYSIV